MYYNSLFFSNNYKFEWKKVKKPIIFDALVPIKKYNAASFEQSERNTAPAALIFFVAAKL